MPTLVSDDKFAHKSKSWDMNSRRVKNAKAIADKILKNIKLRNDMTLMDLGAGTGLLTYFVAPHVGKIVAADNSPSMLEVFEEKSPEFACETEVLRVDIEKENVPMRFDGVISSMTIHHIADIPALFSKLHALLEPGGFIAIADLDKEDGTFHSEDTGVHHFGFNRDDLRKTAQQCGFENIAFETVNIIRKPHRDFPVFLMTAYKGK
jgi:cyclopropane fatty-acyl-phospholipid synthase-like methyltransferase